MTEIEQILQSNILSGFRGTPSGHLGGEYVQALEAQFRDYFGVDYAIALNSATAALHASLVACDVGVGDEIIVSPFTFSSSASCVLMVGAKPVFADIQDDIFCIDPDKIEALITPRTKAIIPVHLCGHPAEMAAIMRLAYRYNLKVIEDAAQSIGAVYRGKYTGTIGDCGVFSFNQSKHINTGEGGMLITNDDKIARIVRAVRNHGEISDPELRVVGYNYRLCEIEASLASEQFKQLDEMTAHRIKLTNLMSEGLKRIKGFTPPVTYPDCRHVFYTYAVKFDEALAGMKRDEFQDKMIENGIYFGKGYVKPLYLLPIYQQFGYKEGLCPVTEKIWKQIMVTDIFKFPMPEARVYDILNKIKEILE
tara:strand:+ start:19689 stop:20783 length:1095 start_codon:yes stop_codon:yes gene_type:complete